MIKFSYKVYCLIIWLILSTPLATIKAQELLPYTGPLIENKLNHSQLPTPTQWQTLSLPTQIHSLVAYIYLQNQANQPVEAEQVWQLIEKDYEVEHISHAKEKHLYRLEEANHTIDLTLVFDSSKQVYIEALAQQELPAPHSQFSMAQFKELGELLRHNYAQTKTTHFSEIKDQLGQPASIAYLFDVVVYQYEGRDKASYALTVRNHIVSDLNYRASDTGFNQSPLDKTKKDLDRLSHEAGLNPKEMLAIMGQAPMSINYDSQSGIITQAWFSNHPDSEVSEIFYYYAYNGISIGVAYQ